MEMRLISTKAVCERTSLSRSTIDRLVAAGEFPKPVRITSRRLAYSAAAVDGWLQEKVPA